MKKFSVVSVNISEKTGEPKKPVTKIVLKENHGVVGDAHAKDWHRQVSLLAMEDIERMKRKLASLKPGDFAENITTRGIDLSSLPIGTRLYVGGATLEITQIGKQCHAGCAIFKQAGDCVMPRRGAFAKVLTGGEVDNESTGTYGV